MQATCKKGIYRHFKGNLYKVLELARHSETQEWLVVYQSLYGDKGIWARPLSMFTEHVEVNGVMTARFTYMYAEEKNKTVQ